KFTILAPNTHEMKRGIENVEKNINDWLIKVSYGETTIGLSFLEATANDFVLGNFIELWERMGKMMEKKKWMRVNLDLYGGEVRGYLDSFVNELTHPLCPICGKRPSSPMVEGTSYVGETWSACKLCRDHIFLGTNLVKKNRLAVTAMEADIRGEENKLSEPIFGEYQLAFLEGGLKEMVLKGQLFKYWDLSINPEGEVARDITIKFISGYVPVYTAEDEQDDRILAGAKSEAKKLELIDQINPGDPKTFGHIACMARNPTKEGKLRGVEALGVLKADVDHLGLLMACGLKPERFTLSRIATLSRQLHYYFAVYLPHILMTQPSFRDIYTVFAGGDDLFLIGPWNRVIDLVNLLQMTFSEYVCHNQNIHFSAGISLHKPQTPLDTMAEAAESVLEKSKHDGRNRLTLFSETATWDQVEELSQVKQTLLQWIDKGLINQAMLYRLNILIEMAGEEKRVVHDEEIFIDDMSCTKWRSILAYTTERNVAKSVKGEARKAAINEVAATLAGWLTEYGRRLRIPLWDILYNRR
ncbi:MAG: type III-A CRISPR-associated protein Cas10/Csm1, partial [Pseudomonadota bacterium]